MEGFLSEVMRLGRPLSQQADDEPLQRPGDGDGDSRPRKDRGGVQRGSLRVAQPGLVSGREGGFLA